MSAFYCRLLFCFCLLALSLSQENISVEDSTIMNLVTLRHDTNVFYSTFVIPENTLVTTVQASIIKSNDFCSLQKVYGGIKSHGYPYLNPLDATIIPPIIVNENEIHLFQIDTKIGVNNSLLTMYRPLSGQLFIGAYVTPHKNEKTCSLQMKVTVSSQFLLTNNHIVGVSLINESLSTMTMILKTNTTEHIKFLPEWQTVKVAVKILRCRLDNKSNDLTDVTKCPIQMSASADRLPLNDADSFNNCCEILVDRLNGNNHFGMILLISSKDIQIELAVEEMEDCNGSLTSKYSNCIFHKMTNYQSITNNQSNIDMLVPVNSIIAMPFHLIPNLETSGSLYVSIGIYKKNTSVNNMQINTCLQRGGLVSSSHFDNENCEYKQKSKNKSELAIPYPKYGHWSLQFQILFDSGNASLDQVLLVTVKIQTFHCHPLDVCGRGSCRSNITNFLTYFSCACPFGYGGIGCTPLRNLPDFYHPILHMSLITASNFLYGIASIISLRCRLYLLSILYFYSMLASTLFHACDLPYPEKYCIIDYDYLSICDFFGAIMSVWVTLLTIAFIPDFLVNILSWIMALALLVAVLINKMHVLTYALPLFGGICIALVSWIYISFSIKNIFPPWRYILLHLLPASLLTVLALTFRSYGHLSTGHWYIIHHSLWHVCSGCCACIVLHSPAKWRALFSWSNKLGYHVDMPGIRVPIDPTMKMTEKKSLTFKETLSSIQTDLKNLFRAWYLARNFY